MGDIRKVIDIVNEAIEKSKELTTEKRESLPDSAFCGPGRSFPCHDCAHVNSAKAYLNRSNYSLSTRKKIAACINKKAKALGCGGDPIKAKGSEEDIDKELKKN